MKNFYFTFGGNHKDKYGNSLQNAYVKVSSESYEEARSFFWQYRDKHWAFQYNEEDFLPQIEKYNLHEVSILEI